MKLKIYGATGSFPRCMQKNEIVEKLYHYQKKINENNGFESLIAKKGFKKIDKNNISLDDFSKLIEDISIFDFWISATYGGNTSCLYIETSDKKHIAFDAGSGFVYLSKYLMQLPGFKKNEEEIYIFLSHYHWDHIHGIPFSALIFTQNKMKFVGMKIDDKTTIKEILEGQMNKYNFPIPLNFTNKNITFYEIDKSAKIGTKTEIIAYPMPHPLVGSLTYKIIDLESKKSIVYATDFEQPPDKLEKKLIDICKGSDVLIIDAHFSPGESTNFQGWGHGNFGNAIDLARLSGIKELILFHHNFNKTDKELFKTEKDILGYLNVSKESFPDFDLKIHLAYEGLELII